MSEAPLLTETNTRAVERRVMRAFRSHPIMRGWNKRGAHAVFEHGQWYVARGDGAQFSMVDASGGDGCEGLDFERVTDGEDG